jgi:hypothetical protein
MKQIACLLGYFFLCHPGQSQLQPIGSWREHLPYHQAIAVAAGNEEIFAATPFAIFSVGLSDNSLHRFSKMTALSETGIRAIAFDSTTAKLIIAYSNSNVDIFKNGLVKRLDALKQSTLAGDKTIYSLYCRAGIAYLCTGFGIVVIDENKYEVKDTYLIGQNGTQVKVNALCADKTFFYAATEEGLKRARTNTANLADYRSWELISGSSGLTAGPIQEVMILSEDHPLVLKNDSLFLKQDINWSFFYNDGSHISSIVKSDSQILLSEFSATTGRIILLNQDATVARIIQNAAILRHPEQIAIHSNDYWIADSITGLLKLSGNSFTPYVPNSPASIAAGELVVNKEVLWAASGTVNSNWQGQNDKNGLYKFSNDQWENLNSSNLPALDSLPDLIALTTDPRDGSLWTGSFGGGLLHLGTGNSITVYKQNSPLQFPVGSPGRYNVSGLAFDVKNNLWISNYGAAQNIHVRKADGSWKSFAIPFFHSENAVSQILIDEADQKWIVSPKGNGLIAFNHGASLDNPADDKWRFFKAGKGNGNLPDNLVLCIAKDRNGFIWVGTGSGIGIIQCAQEIFTNPACEAVLPVVQQGNFNGYLFHDEQVQSIAVDGADRKWIGTRNGTWLVSEDGEKTIYHFTEDNSPLLSNDVKKIAINGTTGEVFFSTAKGICSFRSTATEGSNANTGVLVFPNPVPPGYNGQIAVRGLVNNAIVKITEMDGRLVYQSRAFGGQLIWNGKDYKGRKASSGVYLVLVTDDNRKENLVTKIVFIN